MSIDATPTVRAVLEGFRKRIRDGEYRPGEFLPAEMDLAAQFRVSRGTVRRAISLMVASGEIERRPHSRPTIGLSSRGANSEQLGSEVHVWVSHPIGDEATLRFLKGISKGLHGSPYRIVVREPSRFVGSVVQADERQFLSDVANDDAAIGAIIQRDPYATNEEEFRKLVARGKHVVFVDTEAPGDMDADYVGTANVAAARRCVEHLQELGHNRIYCASDSDVPRPVADRIQGYWRAMSTLGIREMGRSLVATELPANTHLMRRTGGIFARTLTSNPYFSEFAGRLATAILEAPVRPTAVFVCYDVLALWLCAYLEGSGMSIPGDISVFGFDWIARWDESIPDELTTACQDFEGFGRHAADLFLDRVADRGRLSPRSVLLEAPLVIRSTTASQLVLPVTPANETSGKEALISPP